MQKPTDGIFQNRLNSNLNFIDTNLNLSYQPYQIPSNFVKPVLQPTHYQNLMKSALTNIEQQKTRQTGSSCRNSTLNQKSLQLKTPYHQTQILFAPPPDEKEQAFLKVNGQTVYSVMQTVLTQSPPRPKNNSLQRNKSSMKKQRYRLVRDDLQDIMRPLGLSQATQNVSIYMRKT